MPKVFSQVSNELEGTLFSEAAQMAFALGRPPFSAPAANQKSLLVQALNISYRQPFSRFYEMSSSRLYYVAGRTRGTARLNQVCGPHAIMGSFHEIVGSPLPPSGNVVDFATLERATDSEADKRGASNDGYRAEDCALRSIGLNTIVADMAINEGAVLGFSNLVATTTRKLDRPRPR
jgi:hypothetical protein